MGGCVFGMKDALHTFSLAYEKSMVSTPGHKTMEVVIQTLVIRKSYSYTYSTKQVGLGNRNVLDSLDMSTLSIKAI